MKNSSFVLILIFTLASCSDDGFEYLLSEYNEGSAYSAGKLGWAYQQGLGVAADLDRAKDLYEYAAGRGMTYWQYLLGHAYEKGYLGYQVDLEKAEYWLSCQPKVHIALYECWVANCYRDGVFPSSIEVQKEYEQACENANK